MRVSVKVCITDDQGEKFMGDGPYELLQRVEQCGSMRQAALEMNMSYAKAHRILKRLEAVLGVSLFDKYIGGAKHGGTNLTPAAQQLLVDYAQMRQEVSTQAEAIFANFLKVRQEAHSDITVSGSL